MLSVAKPILQQQLLSILEAGYMSQFNQNELADARKYDSNIKSRYNLSNEEDIVDILDSIGKKIGAFRNGETDYEKVYQVVMKDLKDGYLGQVTFDWRGE
jgi:ribosome biogenesis GTPase A